LIVRITRFPKQNSSDPGWRLGSLELVGASCFVPEHCRLRAEPFPASSAEDEYDFADWLDLIIHPVCPDTANTNQLLIESQR